MRDVMVFLQAHGASGALALRILKRYGGERGQRVSREPYRLAMESRGSDSRRPTASRGAGVARDSPRG